MSHMGLMRANLRQGTLLTVLVTALVACDVQAQSITALEGGSGYSIATDKISARVDVVGGRFSTVTVRDLATDRAITLLGAFTLRMQDGTVIPASSLNMERPLAEDTFAGGKRICAELLNKTSRIQMGWCLLAREHAGYVRQQVTIRAVSSDLPIAEVRLLDFADREARVAGTVKGSPIVDDTMFFGFEHPLAWSRVDAGHAAAGITRQLPLRAGQSVTYSSVVGVAAPGQMRRDFLAYVEAERPRPYQPFLHYNSWFDLGYENRYDEAGALDRVHAFGS